MLFIKLSIYLHSTFNLVRSCLFIFVQFFQQRGIPYDPEYLFGDCQVGYQLMMQNMLYGSSKSSNVCFQVALIQK